MGIIIDADNSLSSLRPRMPSSGAGLLINPEHAHVTYTTYGDGDKPLTDHLPHSPPAPLRAHRSRHAPPLRSSQFRLLCAYRTHTLQQIRGLDALSEGDFPVVC